MAEEKNENINSDNKTGQIPKDFGGVIDALHSKQKLASLRTYQGDMAEFIKEKNESTMSIALKEKERKEERKEEKEQKEVPILIKKKVSTGDGFKINLTSLSLSLLLLAGGVVASLYIFQFAGKEPLPEVTIDTEIIPYNNFITLANLTNKNIGEEFAKLAPSNGVSIIKISNVSGSTLQNAKDLLDFLDISLPGTLERTLKSEYAIGMISQNNQKSYFLALSVNDFGRAFSGMLEWEKTMEKDLAFFSVEIKPVNNTNIITSTTTNALATTTSTTTKTLLPPAPLVKDVFNWKDIIIKNKDTRALVNQKNQAKIAYTFLDKNIILITNNLSAIGDMSTAYASRSVAR